MAGRFFFILAMFSATVRAGDSSMYEVLGFSADGKYVAFERYGTYDGSGFPYSEIMILDVLQNDYVIRPFQYVDENPEAETDVRALNRRQAETALKKFGILSKNIGKIEWKADGSGARTASWTIGGDIGSVVLEEIIVDRECDPAGNAKIFVLTFEAPDGASITLQRDSALPASRGCPYEYRLAAVHRYLDYLAVIVEYSTPGYEGPNVRQLIVTGHM